MRKALTKFDVLLVVGVLAVFFWSLSLVADRDGASGVIEEVDGTDPGAEAAAAAPAAVREAASLPGVDAGELEALLGDHVDRGYPWEIVIVHHTDGARGNAATLQTAARVPHFVIGNGSGLSEGKIEATQRWVAQVPGTHAGAEHVDRRAIGVSLIGDFTDAAPSDAQLESAMLLVCTLCRRYGIPPGAVALHREAGALATACPGDAFPAEAFREGLEDLLRH